MEENLVLYRGDSTKIKEFDTKKTFKHCLLGQGIYLTDKLEVADSYRDKGSYHTNQRDNTLVNHIANISKEEALKQALVEFALRKWKESHNTDKLNPKKAEEAIQRFKYDFFNLQDAGCIEIENKRLTDKTKQYVTFTTVKLIEKNALKEGYLTEFHFPKAYLERNIINVDSSKQDKGFLEILYSQNLVRFRLTHEATLLAFRKSLRHIPEKFMVKTQFPTLELFIEEVYRYGFRRLELDYNKIRSALRDYGILGFEYNGGMRIGGCGYHRAFVLWDDSFVNEHKVSRRR